MDAKLVDVVGNVCKFDAGDDLVLPQHFYTGTYQPDGFTKSLPTLKAEILTGGSSRRLKMWAFQGFTRNAQS